MTTRAARLATFTTMALFFVLSCPYMTLLVLTAHGKHSFQLWLADGTSKIVLHHTEDHGHVHDHNSSPAEGDDHTVETTFICTANSVFKISIKTQRAIAFGLQRLVSKMLVIFQYYRPEISHFSSQALSFDQRARFRTVILTI